VYLEVAVPAGESGAQLSRRLLDTIETLVQETKSYRGKVLSLEATDRYSGHTGVIKVHKLRSVRREDVILPKNSAGRLASGTPAETFF
jgi:cell division protease FtsH